MFRRPPWKLNCLSHRNILFERAEKLQHMTPNVTANNKLDEKSLGELLHIAENSFLGSQAV